MQPQTFQVLNCFRLEKSVVILNAAKLFLEFIAGISKVHAIVD